IDGAGAKRGPDLLLDEGGTQIAADEGVGPCGAGPRLQAVELFALADVGHHGDHLAAVRLLQPGDDDRRIEAPRVGEQRAADHGRAPGREETPDRTRVPGAGAGARVCPGPRLRREAPWSSPAPSARIRARQAASGPRTRTSGTRA